MPKNGLTITIYTFLSQTTHMFCCLCLSYISIYIQLRSWPTLYRHPQNWAPLKIQVPLNPKISLHVFLEILSHPPPSNTNDHPPRHVASHHNLHAWESFTNFFLFEWHLPPTSLFSAPKSREGYSEVSYLLLYNRLFGYSLCWLCIIWRKNSYTTTPIILLKQIRHDTCYSLSKLTPTKRMHCMKDRNSTAKASCTIPNL